ncbi:MAG: RNA polymerase sigma factor [Armatimonadetes bacterium]|nr:RNA polymerase sigma factor [Armatimonadota bacterium]
MSDEELMEKVAAGDAQALGALFERYKQPVFGFLYRMLHESATAEDVLQDTFLRIYDRRRSYRSGMRFSTWLYTIARNLALDRLKRSSHRELSFGQVIHEPHTSDVDSLQKLVEKEQLASEVRRAVDSLPEDQRFVIVLREYQDLSYAEISRITGATEEAVRVRAHRARLALRKALASFVETDEG